MRISPILLRPEFIELPTCTSDQSTTTTLTDPITVTATGKKLTLGQTANIKFLAVVHSEESIAKEDICTKTDGDNTNLNIIGEKVKIVLYKFSDKIKIVIVGTITEDVFKPYMIEQTEKDKKFVYVETVKCIANTEVTTYLSNAVEPKPFITGSSYLCFVHDLISKDVTVTETKESKNFEFVVSKYPQQPCPKCSDLSKPTDCKTS